MGRIGKRKLEIPKGVTVNVTGGTVSVKGPKGTLTRTLKKDVSVAIEGDQVTFTPARDTDFARALWGTYAAHLHNMIAGVQTGFEKKLEVEGVGFRSEAQGQNLKLNVGFSHPVVLVAPEGISVAVEKNLITISGADKDAVGQFAANVRAVKKPEPYKGKGIHYVGEYIIRKQGKKAV